MLPENPVHTRRSMLILYGHMRARTTRPLPAGHLLVRRGLNVAISNEERIQMFASSDQMAATSMQAGTRTVNGPSLVFF